LIDQIYKCAFVCYRISIKQLPLFQNVKYNEINPREKLKQVGWDIMNIIREKNRKEWTGVKRPGKEPMFHKNNDILRHVLQNYYSRLLKYCIMQVIS